MSCERVRVASGANVVGEVPVVMPVVAVTRVVVASRL